MNGKSKKNKHKTTAITLITIATIITFFIFLWNYNSRLLPKKKVYKRQGTCRAYLLEISRAVGMYNLNASESQLMKVLDIEKLVQSGYLKKTLQCPEGGSYSGDNLAYLPRVKCSIHPEPWLKNENIIKCKGSIRKIEEAAAKYNKDNKNSMEFVNLKKLLSKGYLKEIPKCPENGHYSGSIFHMDGRVRVVCSIHDK